MPTDVFQITNCLYFKIKFYHPKLKAIGLIKIFE